ncbi:phage portal protein, HK97 family [Bacillus thuringiensis Sbt003]|uniref:Phage portal protein, HK97 family n=1 Tax=Bacillus thuringiensis Sbt003 TaxID=1235825 RepID=A0A9X0F5E3_BACTU|nr:phage portal protein, HK97 family [Bacillus thuringiensis Sbt003]
MLDAGAFSINKVLELEDMDGIGEYGDKHRVDLNHVSIEIADEYQLAKANGGSIQKTNYEKSRVKSNENI